MGCERIVVGRVLRHPLGHDEVIVGNRDLRRVAEHELVAALAQKARILDRCATASSGRFSSAAPAAAASRPAPGSVLRWPLPARPAPGRRDRRPSAMLRTCRLSRARVSRSACSLSTRSLLALAAMRVESIATRPSFTMPCCCAHSSTCVNASFNARAVPAPKRAQRPVVHPLAARQIAERQVFDQPPLHLPRAGHAQRVGVQPHPQHQLGRVKLTAFGAVALTRTPSYPTAPPLRGQKSKVTLAQLIPHARRQQIRLIRAVQLESRHTSLVAQLRMWITSALCSSHADTKARTLQETDLIRGSLDHADNPFSVMLSPRWPLPASRAPQSRTRASCTSESCPRAWPETP